MKKKPEVRNIVFGLALFLSGVGCALAYIHYRPVNISVTGNCGFFLPKEFGIPERS